MNKKQSNLQHYAFVALILSALACLASAFFGLMIGLNSVGWYKSSDINPWRTAFWVSLALIVIGIAVYGILLPDRVRRFFTGRQARYGSNSLILILAVVSILFILNLLAYNNNNPIQSF